MMKNQKAFTLTDLLLTVAILAVLAGAAIPSMGNILTDAKLQEAAGECQLMVQYAQRHAAVCGESTRVRFLADENRCVAERWVPMVRLNETDSTELVASDVESGQWATLAHPLKEDDDYQLSLASNFEGVILDLDVNRSLVFDEAGVLASAEVLTLYLSDREVTMSVAAVSAQVQISEPGQRAQSLSN